MANPERCAVFRPTRANWYQGLDSNHAWSMWFAPRAAFARRSRGVRAGEVGAVHLGRVDVREDVLEVAALGRDRHAAVDQRAATHAAALVHLDPRELLGVEDPEVALHLLADPEAHEVADRLTGGVREPGGALVRIEHPREDLAVRPRCVPAAAQDQNAPAVDKPEETVDPVEPPVEPTVEPESGEAPEVDLCEADDSPEACQE
ncbi:hypothetical protein AB0P16_00710 [Dietzia maris]|uniref:hypothetical protein n=1 Tax=Dietzia maris TaxID=37915 RepID=UPI00342D1BC8